MKSIDAPYGDASPLSTHLRPFHWALAMLSLLGALISVVDVPTVKAARDCSDYAGIVAIADKAVSWGWLLGKPTTGIDQAPDRVGCYQHFKGGEIYWTRSTGARVIYGEILKRWRESKRERGYGYPTTDELETPDGRARYSIFQRAAMVWTGSTGVQVIHGIIDPNTQIATEFPDVALRTVHVSIDEVEAIDDLEGVGGGKADFYSLVRIHLNPEHRSWTILEQNHLLQTPIWEFGNDVLLTTHPLYSELLLVEIAIRDNDDAFLGGDDKVDINGHIKKKKKLIMALDPITCAVGLVWGEDMDLNESLKFEPREGIEAVNTTEPGACLLSYTGRGDGDDRAAIKFRVKVEEVAIWKLM